MRTHLVERGELEADPEIPDWLKAIWRAWHRLHQDRPWRSVGLAGLLPGPIPWREVVAWCEFHGLAGDDVPFYDAVIRAMDAEFLSWHAAQRPKGNG